MIPISIFAPLKCSFFIAGRSFFALCLASAFIVIVCALPFLLTVQLPYFEEVVFEQLGVRTQRRESYFYFCLHFPYLFCHLDYPFPECLHCCSRQPLSFNKFLCKDCIAVGTNTGGCETGLYPLVFNGSHIKEFRAIVRTASLDVQVFFLKFYFLKVHDKRGFNTL